MTRTDDLPAWLHAEDRQRAAFLPPARRSEWLLGRAALQQAVAAWCSEQGDCLGGVEAAMVRIRPGALGEPRLATLHARPIAVSLAHGGELVVGVATGGENRVGVDVEPEHRAVARLITALLPEERVLVDGGTPLLHVLMAKEAAAKAWQIGLGGALQRWPVESGPHGSLSVSGPDRGPLAVEMRVTRGHVIAICLARRQLH